MPFLLSAVDLLRVLPDIMQVFLAVWLFAVGACVGSFVNVVALRLPAGIGIAHSSSRCPRCLHPIRWYDNIPLISWLDLRGQCRDCGIPIPVRYPLVELLVGLLFLALALGEALIAARNLPVPQSAGRFLYWTPAEVWTLYAFHGLLVTTLFTVSLMRFDRSRVPFSVFVPAIGTGLVAAPLLAWLHPTPTWVPEGVALPGWALSSIDALTGGAMGWLLGQCVRPHLPRRTDREAVDRSAEWACVLSGIYLGVPAVAVVVLAATSGHLLVTLLCTARRRLRSGPWCAYLTLACLLYIISWRHFDRVWAQLSAPGTLVACVLLAMGAYALSRLAYFLTPCQDLVTCSEPQRETAMNGTEAAEKIQAILNSPSYLPVEYDAKFLQQPELRPVRVQLELLKPELALAAERVHSTIVVFGGTQIVEEPLARVELERAKEALAESPDDLHRQRSVARLERILAKSPYYDAARRFAQLVSESCQVNGVCDYVITTGGGPGIMEAANRGAQDVGAKSIGLNITIPTEQVPNPYVTPNLCFQFHYFALRKMHFLMRAKALVVFPGGFGTLDELFDALTLRQTRRMQQIPILLFGREYWKRVIDFQFLADEGVIADEHLNLISYAETPEEAWEIIRQFHRQTPGNGTVLK
jgi:uncharacterized protein (TIGR00730 family)